MENPSSLILEISSDEEAGFDGTRKGSGGGGDILGDFDYDFLSKMLGEFGGNKDVDDDDSDDVVFVSEVLPNAPKKSRVESLKPPAKVVDDDDDDDCVVLDGDPDKAMVVVNGRVDDDDDDSDDLEIIGEKGEVACRDFPHSRHLCAKFAFASTPHEVHCSQCHCFVCDSLAPCSHWGTGDSSVNHCHASDKEEYWLSERKRTRKGDKPAQVTPSITDTCLIEALRQLPSFCPTRTNPLPQSQGLRPAITRPRPISSNVSLPHVVHQSAQSFAPRTMFKRPGIIGASPNNTRARGSQFIRSPPLKRHHPLQTPVTNLRHGSNQRNFAAHSVRPSQMLRMVYPVPSQRQIHSNPSSRCLIREPIHGQPQTPSRPFVNTSFVNQQPHEVFQPYGPVLPQNIAPSYQPDAGNAFGNQLHSRSIIPPHPMGNNFENQSSQPQAYNNPTSLLISGQTSFQQTTHAQNGVDASQAYFNRAWHSSLSHGQSIAPADNFQYQSVTKDGHNQSIAPADNIQCRSVTKDGHDQSMAPADNFQYQNVTKDGHNQSIAPVDSVHQQSVVPTNYSSIINDKTENTKPVSSDFQFSNQIFENQTLAGTLEGPMSPVWNVFSPEHAFIDTDLFPY